MRSESNPISDETSALIKEKRRLRRQCSQIKGPAVKTRINQLQKQVKEDLRVETQASWEKFCSSVSLETDPRESWRKIKNLLKPKGQRDYPTLLHDDKVVKTNADKAQLFASMDLENIIILVFSGFSLILHLAHHIAKLRGPVAKILLQNVRSS